MSRTSTRPLRTRQGSPPHDVTFRRALFSVFMLPLYHVHQQVDTRVWVSHDQTASPSMLFGRFLMNWSLSPLASHWRIWVPDTSTVDVRSIARVFTCPLATRLPA